MSRADQAPSAYPENNLGRCVRPPCSIACDTNYICYLGWQSQEGRLAASRLVGTSQYVAVICLGAVIRGETTHDQYINRQVTDSLGRLSMESGVPVAFGLLTCNSLEQAIHRAGGNVGNKGVESAEAALEMVSLLATLDDQQ